MRSASKVIIIGAGPAGVGAALSLGSNGIVLEQASDAGGLSCSVTIDGAVFDYGGHSFHTPHSHVHDLVFSTLEMYEQKRNAQCFVGNQCIPYPFQKSFHLLDDRDIVRDCEEGLGVADEARNARDFEDFIVRRFGSGISRHFMLPYNRKLWGPDLQRLAAEWTKERVAPPKGEEAPFETEGGKRKPLAGDTRVAYPARGGFGEIINALSRRIPRLYLGQRVARIDPIAKSLVTEQGAIFRWHKLVSTLPIDVLLNLVEGAPEELKMGVSQLELLSLRLALVVVGHPVDTEIQRIYTAENDIPAHKIAVNHNSSPYLRRLPHHGIIFEMSTGSASPHAARDLRDSVVASLCRLGLIRDKSEVRKIEIRDVKYGYPVPTASRDAIIARCKTWLESLDIHTVGRFGEWAYINSDEAIHRGILLGEQLAGS